MATTANPQSAIENRARAWFYLVWVCLQRQARARQMVWIALALLAFTATVVGLVTASRGWGLGHRTWTWTTFPAGPMVSNGEGFTAGLRPIRLRMREVELTYQETVEGMELLPAAGVWGPAAQAVQDGVAAACRAALDRSGVMVFSNAVVFSVFLSFLLPIWSLSFATDTLGGEREAGTLVWLLTRPLSRPAVYLAKFVAVLPWVLGLNLGGFAVLCLAAGGPGAVAFRWYWPAVLWGSLTFAALFHLMSACFRRPAVVAIVYTFFLETVLGNMPGYMKRVSISFYARCLMFDPLTRHGVSLPENEAVYLPVDGTTAWWVLAGATVLLLGVGVVVFARTEYQDLS